MMNAEPVRLVRWMMSCLSLSLPGYRRNMVVQPCSTCGRRSAPIVQPSWKTCANYPSFPSSQKSRNLASKPSCLLLYSCHARARSYARLSCASSMVYAGDEKQSCKRFRFHQVKCGAHAGGWRGSPLMLTPGEIRFDIFAGNLSETAGVVAVGLGVMLGVASRGQQPSRVSSGESRQAGGFLVGVAPPLSWILVPQSSSFNWVNWASATCCPSLT